MISSLIPRLRFIVPASLGISVSFYLGSKLLSKVAHNEPPKALNGKFGNWKKFKIIMIEQISPDTRRFTFELPSNSTLGIQPMSFVLTNVTGKRGPWNIRPYTPISSCHEKGKFQIVVKHIPGGKVSGMFFGLKEADSVLFMGPMLKYRWKPNAFDEVNLLCGGSGITPMFQLIRHIIEDPHDTTKVNLLYANKTEKDILLREELEDLRCKYPEKLSIKYFVDKGSDETEIVRGRISKDNLSAIETNKNTMFFLCGPDSFIDTYAGPKGIFGTQFKVGGILGDLGYTSKEVFRL